MTLEDIDQQWFDKTIPYPDPDPHGLQGQCVQFIRYCLNEHYQVPQWLPQRGACNFWTSYDTDPNMKNFWDRIPNERDTMPHKDDIVIWSSNKGSGFGHIGIIWDDTATQQRFTSIESNWKPVKVTIVTHNYNDVLGFLRRKA